MPTCSRRREGICGLKFGGYNSKIHLIKIAEMIVTDSGVMLQEAHFAQTPYVFVLDIDSDPEMKIDVALRKNLFMIDELLILHCC